MAINIDSGEFLSPTKFRLSLRRFLFYFITLAALVLIYLKFSEIQLLKEVFLRSNLFWLVGIIISQFFSYYALALNYRDVLRVKNLEVGSWELFPITFAIQFLNQALPSATLSGQAFFIQYLKKYGLTLAEGVGRAAIELLTLCVAFGVFFFVSAIMVFRDGLLNTIPAVAYVIYLFVFIGAIFTLLFFAFQKGKQGKIAGWVINRIHRYFEHGKKTEHTGHLAMFFDEFRSSINLHQLGKKKKALFSAMVWQGFVLLFNVLTLYFVALAIDANLSFSGAFIAFTLTKFVSMISFVPGAFGIFEGGMTLILVSFGVPGQPAFAMTLLFRAFTFWFPMPIGWLLFRHFLHKQESEALG